MIESQVMLLCHSISGGCLRMDYNFGALGPLELLIFANYGYFQNWKDEEKLDVIFEIHNPFWGVELQCVFISIQEPNSCNYL